MLKEDNFFLSYLEHCLFKILIDGEIKPAIDDSFLGSSSVLKSFFNCVFILLI